MSFPLCTINHTASGAIEPYRIVKPGGSDGLVTQASAADDALVGVSGVCGAADGERIDIEHAGVVPCQVGGTVARGDRLTSDADGKAVKATAGDRVIGIALEAGTADEIIRTLLVAQAQDALGGTYVPALTGVTNVADATLRAARYLRVGDVVHVTVDISIDPTAAAATQLRIALPVASAIAQDYDVSGVATIDGGAVAGSVKGDAANDAALLDFTAAADTAQTWRAMFSYVVA